MTDALPLLAGDCRIATSFRAAPAGNFDLLVVHESVSLPASFPVATVTDELGYDRLLASIPFRAAYRHAYGVSSGQKLVVLTGESTVDEWFATLDRLTRALPPERYRIAAVAPAGRQVRSDVVLLPPEGDWRSALVAADLVVGGCGPATRLGAALGLPILLASPPPAGPLGDVTALLRRHAHRLHPGPVLDQVITTMRADRAWQDELAARITTNVGYAAETLRRRMYRLLNLAEPLRPVPCSPVPLPSFVHGEM